MPDIHTNSHDACQMEGDSVKIYVMRSPKLKFFLSVLITLFMMPSLSLAQQMGQRPSVLFGHTEFNLEDCIKDMNARKAAIAYNIANASSPGFKPIRFPDEIDDMLRLYGDESMLHEVNIDDEMVRATNVRLKHSLCVKLLGVKMGITRTVVTQGKGG